MAANKKKISRKQMEKLWDKTLVRVNANGVERILDDLMEETGWSEHEARKFAGLALKYCAVEIHSEKALKDQKTGMVIAAIGVLLLIVVKLLENFLAGYFFALPPVLIIIGGYVMLRGLMMNLKLNKGRRMLPPPPHQK